MTANLRFTKMSGAGNDFILIDAKTCRLGGVSLRTLARKLSCRRTSIGADGILWMTRESYNSPTVEYFNADGSRAFCANGSRCAAWWAHQQGWVGKRFLLKTIQGSLQACVSGPQCIRLEMPRATGLELNHRLKAAGRSWTLHSINTGVPHAVLESKTALADVDVTGIGSALRKHPAFLPQGTNVNFIKISKHRVALRTYERGVEAETLACGTGATAAAICAHLLRGLSSPIRVKTQGGDALTVWFEPKNGSFENVWLEGPAKIVFQGEIAL